jgi:hypothetical protein
MAIPRGTGVVSRRRPDHAGSSTAARGLWAAPCPAVGASARRNACVARLSASGWVSTAVRKAASPASRTTKRIPGQRTARSPSPAAAPSRHRRPRREAVLHAGSGISTNVGASPALWHIATIALLNAGLTSRGAQRERMGEHLVAGSPIVDGCTHRAHHARRLNTQRHRSRWAQNGVAVVSAQGRTPQLALALFLLSSTPASKPSVMPKIPWPTHQLQCGVEL